MGTYRTFIALRIYPERQFLEMFHEFCDLLSMEQIKWVEEENFHLTLKFTGDTSVQQLEDVKRILDNTVDDFQAFSFLLKGLGYFKTNGMPRVLFAGIEKSETMKALASAIDESLVKAGFALEGRDFTPHLTLGRINFLKNKKAFYSLVGKWGDHVFQHVNVTEIIYYQSILRPAGPEYVPLYIVNLKK